MSAEHDDLREALGLFALNALEPAEHVRLVDHLRTCDECTGVVDSLKQLAAALPFSVLQVDPPATLRRRIMVAAATARAPQRDAGDAPSIDGSAPQPLRRPRAFTGWLAAAAMTLLAVGLGSYATRLRTRLDDADVRLSEAARRLDDTERRLRESTTETTSVRQTLALLTASDATELRLAGQAPARQASGRAFLSRTRGLLFAASNLPSLPAGRTYQVWYLTRGAPVSAGLLRPDAQGNATTSFDVPASTPETVGMAVSLEPEGGVPAPTGALYLATQ